MVNHIYRLRKEAISPSTKTITTKIFGLFIVFYLLANPFGLRAAELGSEDLFRQATIEANKHNYETALQLLEKIIGRDYNNLEAHHALISIKIIKGQSAEEIKQGYEEKLVKNPQDFVSLFSLGYIAALKKDSRQAEDYYLRALSLSPPQPIIYTALSSLEIGKENIEKAKEYLNAASKISPDSYIVHQGLANLYLEKGDFEAMSLAIKEAKRANEIRPYAITPYIYMGLGYLSQLDYEESEKMFNQALEVDRLDSEANASFAELMIAQGEYKKAKTYLLVAKRNLNEIEKNWAQEYIDGRLRILEVSDRINPIYINIFGFIILIFSIVVHEYMHAWFAYRRGDSTAKNAGRLSLNPLAHIDITGSVVLPIVLLLSNAPFLVGWAKPVPINLENFKRPKRDDVVVSLGGPFSNILLGVVFIILFFLSGVVLKLQGFQTIGFRLFYVNALARGEIGSVFWTYVINLLKNGVVINFMLAGLNLLPMPPLDGSHILIGLLPFNWVKKIFGPASLVGIILLFVLVFFGMLDILLLPVHLILMIVFGLMGGVLGLH